MKLASLTTLTINMAVAFAAEDTGIIGGIRGFIPKLFGADQLIDIEEHCEGCQPDYCYAPEQPDFYCYKNGYPKCCTKNKGNCPNNNKPGCECDGNCNPNDDDRNVQRCMDDNDCENRDQFCMFNSGTCGNRGQGLCEPYAQTCNYNLDYVCGCDGRTYDNACMAASNGMSVKYVGECD